MFKKGLQFLACLAVMVCLFVLMPHRVSAEFSVSPDVPTAAYDWGLNNELYIKENATLTVYGDQAGTGVRIYIGGANTGVTEVHLTLRDVSITGLQEQNAAALYISPGVTVYLTLEGDNKLEGGSAGTNNVGGPGIYVPAGARLIIQEGQDGGSLRATGSVHSAGIGGGASDNGYISDSGEIVINSGTVEASSMQGAGIGCGYDHNNSNWGNNGSVTINGGTVTASSKHGPGIGGNGGDITINGGTVTAAGQVGGAGIGGATGGSGGHVLISGQNTVVNATATRGWDVGAGDPFLTNLFSHGSLTVQDGATLNLLGINGISPTFIPTVSNGGSVWHRGVLLFGAFSTPTPTPIPAATNPEEEYWMGVLAGLAATGANGSLTVDAGGQSYVPHYIMQHLEQNGGKTITIKTGLGTFVLTKARMARAGILVDNNYTFEQLKAAGLLGGGSPQTGDNSNFPLWALCSGFAVLGLALLIRRKATQR